MGPFRKFSTFSDQREFRVVSWPGTGSALSLQLGDLSDIATMRSAKERLRLMAKEPPVV
jgi:hypothetical protein